MAAALFLLPISGCSIAKTLLEDTAAPKTTPNNASIVIMTDAGQSGSTATPRIISTPSAGEDSDAAAASPDAASPDLSNSPTTGRPLPEGAIYRPVLAVIDNLAQARPQTGLMLADIVYEFPLDRSDHNTVYLAVFSDEIPLRIGPIRDSRAYLANTALEWGGLYLSLGDPGQTDKDYPLLAASGLHFRAQNSGNAADFFYRDKTITSAEEHTQFFKLLDYTESDYQYTATPSTQRFSFETGVTYEKGKSFVSVGLPFTSSDSNRVVYTYSLSENCLKRSDKNSKNVLSESSTLTPTEDVIGYVNEPITVQNLIVQYVRVSSYDTTYRNIAVIGSGDCDYFINGQHVTGSWSRPTLNDPTTYKLYDGSIIRLEPGNTWIEMMPSTRAIKIRYEN